MSSTTWQFLSHLKTSSSDVKLLYHYHIPKTGGTSVFANLLDSLAWIPFNTDQDKEILRGKLNLFLGKRGSIESVKLLGRSHHNAKTLAKLQANKVYDYAFSFYRDPLCIQLSNMNMIVERIINFRRGTVPKDSEVGLWTAGWIGILDLPGDFGPMEIAERLVICEEYLSRYSSILSRYFPVPPSELMPWLKEQKMLILDMQILDDFQTLVFNVKAPAKSNQSVSKLITASMLGDTFCNRLLGEDVRICESLRQCAIRDVCDERLERLAEFTKG